MSNARHISDMKEAQVAKAWVVFSGANNTILDSYNVSSVTDATASAGQYTVSFETDMANDDYVIVSVNTLTTGGVVATTFPATPKTVSNFRIYALPSYGTVSYVDVAEVHVAIFGELS